MFYPALEVFKKLTTFVARSAIFWEIPGLMKMKKNAENICITVTSLYKEKVFFKLFWYANKTSELINYSQKYWTKKCIQSTLWNSIKPCTRLILQGHRSGRLYFYDTVCFYVPVLGFLRSNRTTENKTNRTRNVKKHLNKTHCTWS